MQKLVVIGMGYVGIPVAVLFADSGLFEVLGIQRRSERSGWKIDLLNAGRSPFPENEPQIAEVIRRVTLEKRTFRVSEEYAELGDADFVLVTVQTPINDEHVPLYESLSQAVRAMAPRLKKGALVCIESTVAPGTTTNLVQPLLERETGGETGKDFHLAFSYERVMVGRLLHNIQNYPRIIGGVTPRCTELAVQLYRSIVRAPIVPTDCLTAETAKTVENAYRDVNIAFANETALMCESLGVDVFKVRELVNNLPNDPSNPSANPVRNMHVPGAGVGGHCLPKDSWLLHYGVSRYGRSPVASKVIVGAREVNDYMPVHLADLAVKALSSRGLDPSQARVTVLGYSFLEDSDDTRNTPARPLLAELLRRKVGCLVIHDPYVRKEELPEVSRDLAAALDGADCAILVTRHRLYSELRPAELKARMRTPIFVDGRNIGQAQAFRQEGIHYFGIGKGNAPWS